MRQFKVRFFRSDIDGDENFGFEIFEVTKGFEDSIESGIDIVEIVLNQLEKFL